MHRTLPSTLLTSSRTTSAAVIRARIVGLKLPLEIRIRLVGKHFRNKLGARPQIPTLPEHFRALDVNLAPSRLDEPVDARSVDVFLEASPSDRAGAHWTAFRVCVEGEIGPGSGGFGWRKGVRAIWIGEHGGAVVDGDHLAVQSWVADLRILVYASADQLAEAIARGMVDNGCAECCEWTRGARCYESVVGCSHPVSACREGDSIDNQLRVRQLVL